MKNVSLIPFTTALEKRFNAQLKKIYVGQSFRKKERPILNNINITDNGAVQITNGIVAVQLANTNAEANNLEGYPKNLTNLFEVDQSYIDQSVPIYWDDLKILEDQLNVIYKQKIDDVKITISNVGITIEKGKIEANDVFIKSNINTSLATDQQHIFKIDPRFLHDCLMFFRQIYKKGYHVRLWTYQSNLIKFTFEDMTYIIAPIRY